MFQTSLSYSKGHYKTTLEKYGKQDRFAHIEILERTCNKQKKEELTHDEGDHATEGDGGSGGVWRRLVARSGLGGFGVKGVLVLVSPPQLCQQEFDTILYEQRNCKSTECTEYIQNLVKGRENLVKMTMEYIQKWIGKGVFGVCIYESG